MQKYVLILKFWCVIVCLVASLIGLGLMQMRSIEEVNADYATLIQRETSRLLDLRSITSQVFQVNRLCLNALIEPEPGAAATAQESALALLQDATAKAQTLKTTAGGDTTTMGELLASLISYSDSVDALFVILQGDRVAEANQYRLQNLRPKVEQLNDLLGKIATDDSAQATMNSISSKARRIGLAGMLWSLSPLAVAIGSLIWAAFITMRYLSTSDFSSEIPTN